MHAIPLSMNISHHYCAFAEFVLGISLAFIHGFWWVGLEGDMPHRWTD